MSTTLHATEPNKIIYFDYIFLGESDKNEKYAMVVQDELGGCVWLDPASSVNSEHAAEVLAG